MKRFVALAVLVLTGTIGRAEASVITFEDLAQLPGQDHVFDATNDAISGGFLFDAATHSHASNRFWGTDNGGTSLVIDDFIGADPVTVSQIGGGAFSLTSIDLSEAHPQAFFTARQVQITGNVFGGGTVTRTLLLDNNLVDNVYGNYFQTFLLDDSFNNLTSFTLTGGGALGGGNYFAIDNVVVGNPVPEPATLSLLGLGSAFLFGRRRRTATR